MKFVCGLDERCREMGWECPLDDPNETEIDGCEDCVFAKDAE